MRIFRIAAVLLLASCFSFPAFAEETPPPPHVDHFRIGAGLGIHYGGYGVNGEYLVNRYSAISAALGYFAQGGPGWAVGARVYPVGSDRPFNPRISGFVGRVATLKETDFFDTRYKAINGGTLGAGMEWRLYKKLSMDFDLFYVFEDLPPGVEKKDHVRASIGIGVKF